MSFISLKRLNKVYPNGYHALHEFSLDIEQGEFVVLVGPSGCGKSTVLRMIAGLEEISSGELYIDDVLSNEVLPKNRDIAMVFQNYALYPHLTVYENMAFGLRMAKVNHEEIDKRVKEAADIIGISELLSRKPSQLSGGQKQRVALGRALVRRPKIFLFDEPLSNVDAQIRQDMRAEILKLHKMLKTTFIYVTHDQVEAMTMANKIVVMSKGHIQQYGTPYRVFNEPKNLYTATFLGSPQMNILEGNLLKLDNKLKLRYEDVTLDLPESINKEICQELKENNDVYFGIRPENARIEKDEPHLKGRIVTIEDIGLKFLIIVELENSKDRFSLYTKSSYQIGDEVAIHLSLRNIHLFNKQSKQRINGVPSLVSIQGAIITNNYGFGLTYNNEQVSLDIDKRMIKRDENRNVSIMYPSDMIGFENKDGYISLKGDITHTKVSGNTKSVFMKLDDGNIVAFNVDKDYIDENTKRLNVYLNPEFISLVDTNTHELLISKHPLLDNNLVVNGVETHIDLNEVTIYKKKPRRIKTIKCVVLDEEELKDKTLVWLKTRDGQYLNIISNESISRHETPFIYIEVK